MADKLWEQAYNEYHNLSGDDQLIVSRYFVDHGGNDRNANIGKILKAGLDVLQNRRVMNDGAEEYETIILGEEIWASTLKNSES